MRFVYKSLSIYSISCQYGPQKSISDRRKLANLGVGWWEAATSIHKIGEMLNFA